MPQPIFETVTVLGAGTMGAGIAQICAQAGSDVRLFEIHQAALTDGMDRIKASLAKAVEKEKISQSESREALEHIQPCGELEVAVSGAELVIEAIPENIALKNSTFACVATAAGDEAVLATNTSSLRLSKIFAGVPNQERCIGTHFFNPPPIMPLVEVVRTDETGEMTLESVLAYVEQLHKDPVVINDSPGFATSRLGVLLGLEAIRMVEEGVASVADIDKVMELGYRHPMGPLKLTDLVGLDVRMAIADYLLEELGSPAFEVPQLMRDMVERGETGKKSGQGFYDWPGGN